MTISVENVNELVAQTGGSLHLKNSRRLTLEETLIPPRKISIIERSVMDGEIRDRISEVWLVGQESADGYRIILRDDGSQFGLVSPGFLSDKSLVLTGWYGDFVSTFVNM